MYGLIDGNNFFVSCERLLRPDLAARPVIVLSNNDGCAVSRSDEAKELGIKMAEPYFKIRHQPQFKHVVALSANFRLYLEMSARMMQVIADLGPEQEIYSIDECFVKFPSKTPALRQEGLAIREEVMKRTGLPVAIGIGKTKTLAKLANHIAKTAQRKPELYPKELSSVCNLADLSPQDLADLFRRIPASEVWGVGRMTAPKLEKQGIKTVHDLIYKLVPAGARFKDFDSIVLARVVAELKGENCYSWKDPARNCKSAAYTRSFSNRITDLDDLIGELSFFTSHLAAKLREEGLLAGQLKVFLQTSRFLPKDKQYSGTRGLRFCPTSDSFILVEAAISNLKAIFRPGYGYARLGVVLADIQTESHFQPDLFSSTSSPNNQDLMATLDAINQKFGRGSIRLAEAKRVSDKNHADLQAKRKNSQLQKRPLHSVKSTLPWLSNMG